MSKLYATATSEKASKGQGGNQYVMVVIRNEKQQCIAHLKFKPDDTCSISVLKDIKASIDRPEWIGTDDDRKGKKQKDNGECVVCDAPLDDQSKCPYKC